MSAVPSLLPSSTKTICRPKPLLPSTSTSFLYVSKMTSCSLKQGTTTDNKKLLGRMEFLPGASSVSVKTGFLWYCRNLLEHLTISAALFSNEIGLKRPIRCFRCCVLGRARPLMQFERRLPYSRKRKKFVSPLVKSKIGSGMIWCVSGNMREYHEFSITSVRAAMTWSQIRRPAVLTAAAAASERLVVSCGPDSPFDDAKLLTRHSDDAQQSEPAVPVEALRAAFDKLFERKGVTELARLLRSALDSKRKGPHVNVTNIYMRAPCMRSWRNSTTSASLPGSR